MKYIANPLLGILLFYTSESSLQIQIKLDGKVLNVNNIENETVIKILLYLDEPLTKSKIREKISTRLNMELESANKILNLLINLRIIINPKDHAEYRNWLNHNWRIPYFYYKTDNKLFAKELPKQSIDFPLSSPSSFDFIYEESIESLEIKKTNIEKYVSNLKSIETRRSIFLFQNEILSKQKLMQILYESFYEFPKTYFRNSMNVLEIFSSYFFYKLLKIYIVILNVADINHGLYQLDQMNPQLRLLKIGNYEKELIEIISGQTKGIVGASIAIIFLCDVFDTEARRSNEMGLTDIIEQLSIISQWIIVIANSYGVNNFISSGINHMKVKNLIAYNEYQELPLYFISLGI